MEKLKVSVELETETVIVLSTAHMPCSQPEWGELMALDTGIGFMVRIPCAPPGDEDFMEWVKSMPEWFLPIAALAYRRNVQWVNFDRDGEVCELFREFSW